MKTFNRIISLLMVALMLVTTVPYSGFSVVAAGEETENYSLTLEITPVDSFTAENSAEGMMSFFGGGEFDGCYGNQLSGVARELYDSLVKNYVEDKITGEYNYVFKTPFTFNAAVSGGSIVMNDELEEIRLELHCAVQAAMDAFLYDHPEVFWLKIIDSSYDISASGNSLIGYTGIIGEITITPTEIYGGASSKLSLFASAVETVLGEITVTESRYETLKSIHDYICENAWYNLVSEQRVHSCEPFFIGDGGVVCEGYAKAFKVLCDRLDIPCVLVSGDAGGAHMWNYVQMDDGKWYLVDATWDDQDSQIYDTYFLANSSTIGFDKITISEERTERTDFSGTGIFSFTYPELSVTAYTTHVHEWDSEYTVDVEPTCTEKGSKSIHCKSCDETKSVTEIPFKHNFENDVCIACGVFNEVNLISYGNCGESACYTLDNDGNMRIFGSGEMYDYDVSSDVRPPWYSVKDSVNNIVIEDGITSIGYDAFSYCYYADSITISKSVVIISSQAFPGEGIERFIVDKDSEYYSNSEDGVLFNKDKTMLLRYPAGNKNTEYTVPNGVTVIGDNAFSGCDELESIALSDSVITIGEYAFFYCGITGMVLGNNVTTVGAGAFSSCFDLREITFGSSIKSIDNSIFRACFGLESITVDENNQHFADNDDGVLYNKDKTKLIIYPVGSKNTSFVIPESVTTINDEAFEFCEKLESIKITDNVTYIGSEAFCGCEMLRDVVIGDNVSIIGGHAFSRCDKIESITIGNSVTKIDTGAFAGCVSLKKIIIGNGVKSIGYKAFDGCDSLNDVHYLGTSSDWLEIDDKGNNYDLTLFADHHYCDEKEKTDSTCTTDGNEAGWYCNDCEKYVVGGEMINKSGHAFSSQYTVDREPTCTVKGSKSQHCTREGCVVQINITAIPATDHTNKLECVQQNATCSSVGYTSGVYCFDCERWLEGHEEIAKLPHTFTYYTSDGNATCIADGTKTAICDVCKIAKDTVADEGSKNNAEHQYSLRAGCSATCTQNGEKIYACDICETATYREIIPATGEHSFTACMGEDPTCTEDGFIEYCCEICETETYRETLYAEGHKGGTATCKSKAECTVCGEEYGSLNKNNHKSVVALKATASTCTKTGLTEGKKCKDCGKITLAQKTVAKKAHTYKTTTTKATLSKNGKAVTKCTVCGTVAKTTTVYYPKTIKLSVASYTYNRKTKTPSVTVKDSKGKTLKKGTDYTVTYPKSRKSIGKYTVTVTFKGNYSGTKKLNFEIVPAKTTLSNLTAGSKRLTATWKTVSGVTGYEVQYSTSNKFTKKTTKTVTVKGSKSRKTTIKKLTKGKKYYVKVRAYKTVGKTKLYGAWSSVKNVKVR